MIDEPEPVPELSEVPQEVEVAPKDPSKVLKIGSAFLASEIGRASCRERVYLAV